MSGHVVFRSALARDADGVAGLHAASWRRFYRGAYSDAYLDGDVVSDRRAVWSSRLAESGVDSATILAEVGGEVAGFAHVIFDEDPAWGALLDNLHVSPTHQRQGIGSGLISRAARTGRLRGQPVKLRFVWPDAQRLDY